MYLLDLIFFPHLSFYLVLVGLFSYHTDIDDARHDVGSVASSTRRPPRRLPLADQAGVPDGCRIIADNRPDRAPGWRGTLPPRCDYQGSAERFRAYSTAEHPTGPRRSAAEAWNLVLAWLVEASLAGACMPVEPADERLAKRSRR